MQTGEGKSIVIAMMAIYTVKMFKQKVHMLIVLLCTRWLSCHYRRRAATSSP